MGSHLHRAIPAQSGRKSPLGAAQGMGGCTDRHAPGFQLLPHGPGKIAVRASGLAPGPCHTDQPDALMLQLCQLQGGLPGVGRHYDLVDSLLPGGFHRQLQGGFGVLGSLSVKCHGASSCFQSRHNRPMGAKSRPQRHNRCPRLLYHAAGRFCNAPARNPLSPAGNV